jgi:hypothetical protein
VGLNRRASPYLNELLSKPISLTSIRYSNQYHGRNWLESDSETTHYAQKQYLVDVVRGMKKERGIQSKYHSSDK